MPTDYVIDTHALIWNLEGNPRLGANATAILADPNSSLFLPIIALAEACWIVESGKTSIASVVDLLTAVDADTRVTVISLDRSILDVSQGLKSIPEIHDRLIVATVLQMALEVMRAVMDEFHDGVWFVELAAEVDPTRVVEIVASVFGVKEEKEETDGPLIGTLLRFLRRRRLLLVLDNCEHLLTACAELAQTLLRECAHLQILATSRQSLGLGGEAVWRVPSLSLPEDSPTLTVQRLMQSEAALLFVARARLKDQHFAATNQNARSIARICQRLDGIPLALEMAAGWVRSLPVEVIEAKLEDRFRLLTNGSFVTLPRHQTLWETIDWSYKLLTERERILLCSLSVFRGGWSLDAAEQIAGEGKTGKLEAGSKGREPHPALPSEQIFGLLDSLVNKSLVGHLPCPPTLLNLDRRRIGRRV